MTDRSLKSAALLSGLLLAGAADAATAVRAPFGTLPDGTAIEEVVLTGRDGVRARIMTLGATLRTFETPDRDGHVADVTLGYDDAASYVLHPNYWGQTVGRYANRIARGSFTLDGRTYHLPINNGANSLHGGTVGFDKRVWRIVSLSGGKVATVRLALRSEAGDQGYPGALDVTATYTLDDHGTLAIDFDARADAPTIVNMTNHAMFDLAGADAPAGIYAHRLTIPAAHYLPVDAGLIPTGERRAVAGTVFDFTHGRTLSDGIRDGRDPQIAIGRGWDHNFVLDKGLTREPGLAARLEEPVSGRVLEVFTTEPGIQFYSGNFLDGTLVGKGGRVYRMGDGLALEPQKFPDTPNQPAFGSARVDPAHPYHHRMIYRASVMPPR